VAAPLHPCPRSSEASATETGNIAITWSGMQAWPCRPYGLQPARMRPESSSAFWRRPAQANWARVKSCRSCTGSAVNVISQNVSCPTSRGGVQVRRSGRERGREPASGRCLRGTAQCSSNLARLPSRHGTGNPKISGRRRRHCGCTLAVPGPGDLGNPRRAPPLPSTRPARLQVSRLMGGTNGIPGTVKDGMHYSVLGTQALPLTGSGRTGTPRWSSARNASSSSRTTAPALQRW